MDDEKEKFDVYCKPLQGEFILNLPEGTSLDDIVPKIDESWLKDIENIKLNLNNRIE